MQSPPQPAPAAQMQVFGVGGWMPGPQWLCPHPAPHVTTSPRPRKPFWDHSPPVAPTAPPRHPMLKAGGSKPVGDKQNKKHHPHPKEWRWRAPTTAPPPKRLKSFTGAKLWCRGLCASSKRSPLNASRLFSVSWTRQQRDAHQI